MPMHLSQPCSRYLGPELSLLESASPRLEPVRIYSSVFGQCRRNTLKTGFQQPRRIDPRHDSDSRSIQAPRPRDLSHRHVATPPGRAVTHVLQAAGHTESSQAANPPAPRRKGKREARDLHQNGAERQQNHRPAYESGRWSVWGACTFEVLHLYCLHGPAMAAYVRRHTCFGCYAFPSWELGGRTPALVTHGNMQFRCPIRGGQHMGKNCSIRESRPTPSSQRCHAGHRSASRREAGFGFQPCSPKTPTSRTWNYHRQGASCPDNAP